MNTFLIIFKKNSNEVFAILKLTATIPCPLYIDVLY